MEYELNGSRFIHLSGNDLEVARERNRTTEPEAIITELEIAEFCSGCDQLKDNNTCSWGSIDDTEQATRAVIGRCEMASRSGKIGTMLAEGFQPWKS